VIGNLQRVGGEFRCGILDEDAQHPFSLAISAAPAFLVGHGLWARSGLDLSLRLGNVAPLIGAYASYGPESMGIQPTNQDRLVYDELRVTGTIGFAWAPDGFAFSEDEGDDRQKEVIVIGASPYMSVWSPEKNRQIEDRGLLVVGGVGGTFR
jgi:hypothetical protein